MDFALEYVFCAMSLLEEEEGDGACDPDFCPAPVVGVGLERTVKQK